MGLYEGWIEPKNLTLALDKYVNKNKELPKIFPKADYQDWRVLVRLSNKSCRMSFNFFHETFINKPIDETIRFVIDNISMNIPVGLVDCILKYENPKEEKENDTIMMNMPAINFEFGPVNNKDIALSPYGFAVADRGGNWFTYNGEKTLNVTGFTFNIENMIYKMPVAIKDLRPGDMVLHKARPMYVINVENGKVSVIDILASEEKTVLPVSNMFGFDFVNKITTPLNINPATPDKDNPFGNLMPFMMMQSLFGENKDEHDSDFGKWMMLSAMTGQDNPFSQMFNLGYKE